MINPTTISELLLFSTVLIEVYLPSDVKATGTGFFFAFKVSEEKFIPAIITNKHVVKGAIKGEFQVHESHNQNLRKRHANRRGFQFFN